jgi:hypothetical protein
MLGWWQGDGRRLVAYRGSLAGNGLRLHWGLDGWQEPIRETRLEAVGPGFAVAELPPLDGHACLDAAVTDGGRWDNNGGADYRLWIDLAPVDSHLHASGHGWGDLGLASLAIAMASAGIACGVVSWMDNHRLDRLNGAAPRLFRLVWTRPGDTDVAEVRERLSSGWVGLKLHPTIDGYRADETALDPYLEVAAELGCPVACHSAPGDADPDYIRRLAERFPTVPIVLYHTYLGDSEGRRRATAHVREQANLFLETSWCASSEALRLVAETAADRVLFGSDASVDGARHYCRHPPNVEGRETYNAGLVKLVRVLGPASTRKVMGENARRLFRLDDADQSSTAR